VCKIGKYFGGSLISRRGEPTTLRGNILSSMRWDMPKSTCVPNLKFLTTHVPKVRNGFQNLQFWHIDPSPPSPLWVILSSRRLDMPRYTTYKISSYTRSKLMKGGPKFTNLALRAYHTPLGEIFCHP